MSSLLIVFLALPLNYLPYSKGAWNLKSAEYFQFQHLLKHIQQLKICKEEYKLLYQLPSQYRVNRLICAAIQLHIEKYNFISIIDSSQDHCSVVKCLLSSKSSLTYLLFRIRNKFVRSVLGRICGSAIWFRDLLTFKVHIFWEGHKNFAKSPPFFDCM